VQNYDFDYDLTHKGKIDKDFKKNIQMTRITNNTLVEIEYVVIDKLSGQIIEGPARCSFIFEIDAGKILPIFETKLLGLTDNDTVEVIVTYESLCQDLSCSSVAKVVHTLIGTKRYVEHFKEIFWQFKFRIVYVRKVRLTDRLKEISRILMASFKEIVTDVPENNLIRLALGEVLTWDKNVSLAFDATN